jgi:hypothetical protein
MLCCLVFLVILAVIIGESIIASQLQQHGIDPPPSFISYNTETARSWGAGALHELADMLHNDTG